MRQTVVKVDEKKSNYLERLNYELRFTKDIIQRIIEAHPNDPNIINGESFRAYQKQGVELEVEYNLAVSEMEKEYLPPQLKGHRYSWIIPNRQSEMVITIQCDCKIEGLGEN